MNEVSNGPSGNMEYVEFVVVDTNVVYTCSVAANPPCIDIRGWIFDDNSGFHGASGVAPGCIRFSNNVFWSCIPVGTIILIYNDLDPNSSLPAIDTLMSDGNCRLVVPVDKINWFDRNSTTPGALACSYPAAGWTAAGTWSTTLLANTGDCARIVNLAGCEVFSVCYGAANTNTLVYFSGSGQDRVFYFNNSFNNDATNMANWTNGCADPAACGSNTQTPGVPNNAANAAWISSLNNSCTTIPALTVTANSTNGSCPCTSSASVTPAGSIGPYTYTWSPVPGSGQGTANASGLCVGVYSCSVESAIGCIETVTVSVSNGTVSTTASNTGSYCAGTTIQLNTPTASSYTWSGPGSFSSSAQNPTISPSTPTMSGTYTVNVTIGSCLTTATTVVTVNALPTVTVNAAVICSGQSTTLTAGGASTYTWSTGPNSTSISVSPTITTNYTVTGNNGVCNNTAITTVSVNALPVITINSPSICSSQIATLTAGGATSYTWNTGPNTSSIVVSPTVTTNYSVTGNNGTCSNTGTTAVVINSNPTITVNSPTLCSSQTNTLTAGGASTYTWNPGGLSGSSVTVSPVSNQSYTVIGLSTLGCTNASVSSVTVIVTPTLSATSSTICPGGTATLSVSGAATYTWNPGFVSGSSYTTAPVSNSTYTVIGANGTCTSVAIASVSIGSGISITVNNPSTCMGQSVTLTASGATTYTWSTGANTSSISVSPTVTGTYTVNGANGSCSGANTSTVTINPTPTVTALNTTTICSGQTVTLTAGGASTYTWNPGGLSGNSVTVSPASSQNYTVTGTDALGCSNIANTTVSVAPSPTVSVPSTTICTGTTATLTASGASTYTWNPGSLTGTSVTVSPLSNTNYSVIGSNGSCTVATTVSVDVVAGIALSVDSPTICQGQATVLTASGASSYTWTGGPNTSTFAVSPTVTTTYSIIGSVGTCSNSISTLVTVNGLPPTPIAQANNPVCEGQPVILNGSGSMGSYSWLGPLGFSSAFSSATIAPTAMSNAGTYTLTVTDANNCSSKAMVTLTVNPLPLLTASSPTTCLENDLILNSSGGIIYSWSGPNNFTSGSQNVVIPNSSATMTGTYTVITTDAQGCSTSRTLDIVIDKCLCPVFIPEGFSPNADGSHDLFTISCIDDRATKVEIYNRWGNLVYKNDDYRNNWDGKNNTGLKVSGEDLPAGTYYYIIKISDENKSRTGFVTLWR